MARKNFWRKDDTRNNGLGSRRFLNVTAGKPSFLVSAPRHHFQKKASEIFGSKNGRQNRMIVALETENLKRPEKTANSNTNNNSPL
jgi:hypothetical protein